MPVTLTKLVEWKCSVCGRTPFDGISVKRMIGPDGWKYDDGAVVCLNCRLDAIEKELTNARSE